MKIHWISDLNLLGSGYMNISVPLLDGLVQRGHTITCAGLGYKGEEHNHNYPIIPCSNLKEALGITQNVATLLGLDIVIVALDITLQREFIMAMQGRQFPYIGIMPLEADPLCMTWAVALMGMDKVFMISEFGTKEVEKSGVQNVEHIRIGVDTEAWKQPTVEQRSQIRTALLGEQSKDDFVVLTVADNQERKHLSKSMEMFSLFAKDKPNSKYLMVTREHLPIGWFLRDLAQEYGIADKFLLFERGIPFKELWSLYAASDVFLLTSKAEGLGLPLLEAMAVGVPCIGTNCTAIAEVLGEGRGHLIDVDYVHRDPFGNGRRYFANTDHGVELLNMIYTSNGSLLQNPYVREYVEGRDWEGAIDAVENAMLEAVSKKAANVEPPSEETVIVE